ncbi:MAG: hypothetical protein WAX89_01990, partial [Alphaproteobacteria bacterium]
MWKQLAAKIGTAALRNIDPETAHTMAIDGLKTGLMPRLADVPATPPYKLFGLPLNALTAIPAGFDKQAEVPAQIFASLGAGILEAGTLTTRKRAGNRGLVGDNGALMKRL